MRAVNGAASINICTRFSISVQKGQKLSGKPDKGSANIVGDDESKKAIHVLLGNFEFRNDGLHLQGA
jgi:hypothetical protein